MALALALDPAAGANTSRTRTFCRFDALTSFGTLCVFVCGSRFQCSAGCNESSRVCSKSWTNSRDSRESFCDSWKLWNYKEVNTVMRHYVWDSRVEESVSQHTLAAINCSRDNLVLWDIFETPTQSPNWFLTLSNKVSNVSFFFFNFPNRRTFLAYVDRVFVEIAASRSLAVSNGTHVSCSFDGERGFQDTTRRDSVD